MRFIRRPLARIAYVIAALALPGCSPAEQDESLYAPTYDRLRVDVFFIQGQEPITGESNSGTDVWAVVRQNLGALLSASGKTISVPSKIEDMYELNRDGQSQWTVKDIDSLFASAEGWKDFARERSIKVFFLDGAFFKDGELLPSTLGVHLEGVPAVAIFKESLLRLTKSYSDEVNGFQQHYIEQSTMVHELGHVMGLVGVGAPVVSDHEDPTHEGHCSNPDCVMYYKNGLLDAPNFLVKHLSAKDLTLFDSACLSDARAAAWLRAR